LLLDDAEDDDDAVDELLLLQPVIEAPSNTELAARPVTARSGRFAIRPPNR
jgi:hypothetical protein